MGWLALLGPGLAQLGCLSFFSELFPFSVLLFLLYLSNMFFKITRLSIELYEFIKRGLLA
jgi:hypothetical protein